MTLRLVFPLMKSEKSRLMFGAFPIHQNAAWAIIVHPSYFFQRQLSFVLSHQWDWLICIGILFERFPFMAVFFHAGTKRRSHSKMDWVVALLGPERQGEVNSKLLVPEWKKMPAARCRDVMLLWNERSLTSILRSNFFVHSLPVIHP